MNWRSITFRLVALYCGLLLLLGASFSLFTVLSFERYTGATIQTNIAARAAEVWRHRAACPRKSGTGVPIRRTKVQPVSPGPIHSDHRDGAVIYRSGAPDRWQLRLQYRSPASRRIPLAETRELRPARSVHKAISGPRRTTVAIESGQSDVFAKGMEFSLVSSLVIGLPVLLLLAALREAMC